MEASSDSAFVLHTCAPCRSEFYSISEDSEPTWNSDHLVLCFELSECHADAAHSVGKSNRSLPVCGLRRRGSVTWKSNFVKGCARCSFPGIHEIWAIDIVRDYCRMTYTSLLMNLFMELRWVDNDMNRALLSRDRMRGMWVPYTAAGERVSVFPVSMDSPATDSHRH